MNKGFLIDPARRVVEPLNDVSYDKIKSYFPGGLCLGAQYPNRDVIYVDDEGLMHPATVAFRLRSRPNSQPFMSMAVLSGPDNNDESGTNDPGTTIEHLISDVEWLTIPEALNWFRDRSAGPVFTLTTGDGEVVVLSTYQDFIVCMEGGEK